MTDMHPDHLHLLALARRAIASEAGPLWKTDSEEAMAQHGAACDALWDELRRQVDLQDGKIPVLEHPSVQQIVLAKRMRATIIAACAAAVEQALDEVRFAG